MGEMADYYAELGIDDLDGQDNGESHDPEYTDFGRIGRCGNVQCRHCGQSGLRWRKTDRGWRLADQQRRLHACPEYHAQAPAAPAAPVRRG